MRVIILTDFVVLASFVLIHPFGKDSFVALRLRLRLGRWRWRWRWRWRRWRWRWRWRSPKHKERFIKTLQLEVHFSGINYSVDKNLFPIEKLFLLSLPFGPFLAMKLQQ